MTIEAKCPKCKRSVRAADSQVGKRVRCPSCETTILVTAEEEAPMVEAVEEERPTQKPRKQAAALDKVELADDEGENPRSKARPAKSRRPADDEDESAEEKKPAKKGGGGGILIGILGGVALLLLLVCGGVVGGVYYAYSKARDAVVDGSKDFQAGLNDWEKQMKEEAEKAKKENDALAKKMIEENEKAEKAAKLKKEKDDLAKKEKDDADRIKKEKDDFEKKIKDDLEKNKDKDKVVVRPDPDKDKSKDPAPKDITAALAMLADSTREKRRRAIDYLNTVEIDEARREEVADALEQAADREPTLRIPAMKAYDRWDPPADVDKLAKKLDSNDAREWRRAMDKLSKLKDERAAKLLASQLGVRGRDDDVAKYLPRMGTLCEKYVLPYYNAEFFSRNHARKVLDEIKTGNDPRVKQCLEDLGAVALDRRRSAVDSLQRLKPTQDAKLNVQVSQKLEEMLTEKDLHGHASQAMPIWVTKESIPGIIKLGQEAHRKNEMIRLLSKFPEDERVIAVFIELLAEGSHRATAQKTLVAGGAKTEKALIDPKVQTWTRARDHWTRRAVYEVLAEVGTKLCVSTLQGYTRLEAAKGGDKNNAAVALNALQAISIREKQKPKVPVKDKDEKKDKDAPKDKEPPKDKDAPKDK